MVDAFSFIYVVLQIIHHDMNYSGSGAYPITSGPEKGQNTLNHTQCLVE